ncbi:MAG: hypothetical protein ABIN67_24875 [Ferruginibacter sp.]
MRILLIIILALFTTNSFSQSAPEEDTTVKFIPVKSVSQFVDSIRKKIISDTSKFKKPDVINTPGGYKNLNSYSPLFFINIGYQYKLDIISGSDVVDFVNEILVSDKIESITLLEEPKSSETFGPNGKNGVILIQLRDIAKVNLNVAGFKPIRTAGNNFH